MKICLLQCNVLNGDLPGNAEKILAMCRKAGDMGADLCIASREAICGPQIFGYAKQPDFQKGCLAIAAHMAQELDTGPALVCGFPNGIMLMQGGCPAFVTSEFFFAGHKFILADAGCPPSGDGIILHMHATPFSIFSQKNLEDKISAIARKKQAPVLAVNLWGGYGNVIYSGQSCMASGSGTIAGRGLAFAEDLLILDMDLDAQRLSPAPVPDCAEWQALVLGTRDFIHKSGAENAIIGLSGGMDSALVACIAVEALGKEHVSGILMPSPFTSGASIEDARKLADNLGIATFNIPIENSLRALETALAPVFEQWPGKDGDLTLENLQARLRGVLLMAYANRTGALVLNTGNKSEAAMGYCTLYGDTAGAVGVIGDVLKTRVYQLARWYCEYRGSQIIPQNIFDKAPSAELRPNQKDSDTLPPYDILDAMLKKLEGKDTANENEAEFEQLRSKVFACQFKRSQSPAPLLVSGYPLDSYPLCGEYKV